MESYTAGLAKKAAAVGESGFDEAATALGDRVTSIGTSAGEFLGILGLEVPPGVDPLPDLAK